MSHKTRISTPREVITPFNKTILANGIRVVSEEIPYVQSASLGVWIDTGSRNESDTSNGISHFLEHMVFKGTEHRSLQQIARSLESVGGYMNAFTTKEHTCFYARVLDEHLEKAVDVLSDLVQFPTFPEKEMEKEKLVVLEEIKNAEDDPDDLIHDYFEKQIYSPSALGYPVIGTAENVSSFTRQHLTAYIDRYYRPDRIVFAAAGNLSHERLTALVEKYFVVKQKSFNHAGRKAAFRPNRQVVEIEKPIQQAHICTGTTSFSVRSRYRFPALVMNTLLGDGMSSRLFQNIRERYGFAYSVYSFMNLLSDTGSFGVYVGTDRKNVGRSLELVFEELRKLKGKPVSQAELARTKAQLKGSMMLSLESTSNRMMRLGSGELYLGTYETLKSISRHIDEVTAEDIQEVAEKLFQERNFSTVIFKPTDQGQTGDESTHDN